MTAQQGTVKLKKDVLQAHQARCGWGAWEAAGTMQ